MIIQKVTKEIFLTFLQCPLLAWLVRTGDYSEPLKPSDQFKIETGIQIEKKARELYSAGVLVDDIDSSLASQKTERLMKDPGVSVIFEGTFIYKDFITKADILVRKKGGWKMIEIKSSLKDDEKYIYDMAYTLMVMELAGAEISEVSLMLLSKEYLEGMSQEKLFTEIGHTEEVRVKAQEFKGLVETVDMDTKPSPEFIYECKGCPLFNKCTGKEIMNPVFDIPRLSRGKFQQLKEAGIKAIEDIPGDFSLTENQERVRDCVKDGKPFIGIGLKKALNEVEWPAFYLDFETFSTALPLYPGVIPYEQILSQYSIHKCSAPDVVDGHLEYLADPSKDCRRDLSENLIRALEKKGSIIVYTSFESSRIKELALRYPDFSAELNCIIERLVDLEGIIKKNFYHPAFHGSTSIKKTLPALVPDMTYDGMEIGDGLSASAYFGWMAQGKYSGEEAEKIKKNLLVYCGQDSLAMVKLHKKLLGFAEVI